MTLLERIDLSGNLQPCENNIPWVNRNFFILDSLAQLTILGFVTEQPLDAEDQDVYALIQDPLLPPMTPKLIIKNGAGWISIEAKAGFRAYNDDDGLFYWFNGAEWLVETVEGLVSGPSSSINHSIARFDGVTGNLIQDSGIIIDDNDVMTGVEAIYAKDAFIDYAAIAEAYVGNLTGDQSIVEVGTTPKVVPLLSLFNYFEDSIPEIEGFELPADITDSTVFYLENKSGALTFIKNTTFLKTPSGGDFQFDNQKAITVIYSEASGLFHIIGGGGGSGSGTVVVDDITERNAIPSYDRYVGLNVFVESEQWNYQLRGGITNSDWTEGGNPTYIYVADSTALFAVPATIRRHGLKVFQRDTKETWILDSGLTNTDWYRFGDVGSSDGDDIAEIFMSARLASDPPTNTLYCGGGSYSAAAYPELALKLWDTVTSKYKYGGSGTYPTGNFNVPDIRGRVVRGVANSSALDPDRASRTAPATGGNTGDNIGSVQGWATRAPNTAFTVNTTGAHTHNMTVSNTGGGAGVSVGDGSNLGPSSTSTTSNGNHTHTVTGGDSETRMQNISANFFIRTKSSKIGRRGAVTHTGTGDPNSLVFTPAPLDNDLFIDEQGDVWVFSSPTWTVSATNLRGPQGYQGGILSVADIPARDAIPALDRYEGMPVFVVSEGKNYQLVGGILDANWKEFAGDTSMTVSATQTLASASAITIADVREQRVKIQGSTVEAVVTIPNGNRDGDKLYCLGMSDSSPCVIATGGNVRGTNDIIYYLGTLVLYIWDDTDSKWDVLKGA